MITVQRAFRAKYAKDPPTDKTIRAWYKQFTETGCLCKQKSSGRPLTTEDDVERVRATFLHSPKKSTGTAAKELPISKITVWRVLHKRVVFNPLKPELNSICYLLALLGAHHFLYVSRIRVKLLTFRLLMSYIWSTHS